VPGRNAACASIASVGARHERPRESLRALSGHGISGAEDTARSVWLQPLGPSPGRRDPSFPRAF